MRAAVCVRVHARENPARKVPSKQLGIKLARDIQLLRNVATNQLDLANLKQRNNEPHAVAIACEDDKERKKERKREREREAVHKRTLTMTSLYAAQSLAPRWIPMEYTFGGRQGRGMHTEAWCET